MSTTVSAFITDLDSKKPNSFTDTNKVSWVNDVELDIYENIYKEYRFQFYNRVKNKYKYTMPSGALWDDIFTVTVDGTPYKKRGIADSNKQKSFYYDGSALNIYPVPTVNDTEYVSGTSEITFKAIEYTSRASELTFASGSIVTTGISFVTAGFVVNNVIDITGCIDETGNNVTATITAVTADTLTFDTGTFTAQAESGTVTLKTNCIYTTGADFSGFTAGEYVLVSGCTDETANNTYAKLAYVGDDVLTFAEDTFTAQAETSAVTIQQPKIQVVYRYRRTGKVVGDILTDVLLLPEVYHKIYLFYCYAQIALLREDFDSYNNYMDLYNGSMNSYENEWYSERREQSHDFVPEDGW